MTERILALKTTLQRRREFRDQLKSIREASTLQEILELSDRLPWQQLDALEERCWELAHEFAINRRREEYIDAEATAGVIITTRIIRVLDDPKAPKNERMLALKSAENQKRIIWDQAFNSPKLD